MVRTREGRKEEDGGRRGWLEDSPCGPLIECWELSCCPGIWPPATVYSKRIPGPAACASQPLMLGGVTGPVTPPPPMRERSSPLLGSCPCSQVVAFLSSFGPSGVWTYPDVTVSPLSDPAPGLVSTVTSLGRQPSSLSQPASLCGPHTAFTGRPGWQSSHCSSLSSVSARSPLLQLSGCQLHHRPWSDFTVCWTLASAFLCILLLWYSGDCRKWITVGVNDIVFY